MGKLLGSMVKRPQIGVSGNAKRLSPSWWCTALVLILAGATPKRISVRHPQSIKNIDGLIVGGGDDISPEHYDGEIDNKIKIDIERDQLEISWINKALQNNIPLIGICRGAQLINVVLGGTLYKDIRPLRRLTYNRPGLLPTKQVRLAQDSVLAKVCNKLNLRVNSLHHQAIKNIGKNLRVVGRDLDGIAQAVESTQNNIIGLQWHPEYLFYFIYLHNLRYFVGWLTVADDIEFGDMSNAR
ncbi:gamma-glutamyl-gamma-aminobutyrate hydrolase family protein [Colwelliaceae bacterium 6471]